MARNLGKFLAISQANAFCGNFYLCIWQQIANGLKVKGAVNMCKGNFSWMNIYGVLKDALRAMHAWEEGKDKAVRRIVYVVRALIIWNDTLDAYTTERILLRMWYYLLRSDYYTIPERVDMDLLRELATNYDAKYNTPFAIVNRRKLFQLDRVKCNIYERITLQANENENTLKVTNVYGTREVYLSINREKEYIEVCAKPSSLPDTKWNSYDYHKTMIWVQFYFWPTTTSRLIGTHLSNFVSERHEMRTKFETRN